MRVPRGAVLVVVPLPGAAAAGEDVEAAALPRHVLQHVAVVRDDGLQRGPGAGPGAGAGADLAAGERVGPHGLAVEAGGEARTLLLVAVHRQTVLLTHCSLTWLLPHVLRLR